LRKWGAIIGAGLALSCAAPASAAVVVFQDTFAFDQSGFKSVFLPKYGGPATITGVSLQFVGFTNKFVDVFAGDEPTTLPEEPVSWTVALLGPAVDDGLGSITFEELGDFVVNTAFPPIDLPGNPGEQVTRITPVIPLHDRLRGHAARPLQGRGRERVRHRLGFRPVHPDARDAEAVHHHRADPRAGDVGADDPGLRRDRGCAAAAGGGGLDPQPRSLRCHPGFRAAEGRDPLYAALE